MRAGVVGGNAIAGRAIAVIEQQVDGIERDGFAVAVILIPKRVVPPEVSTIAVMNAITATTRSAAATPCIALGGAVHMTRGCICVRFVIAMSSAYPRRHRRAPPNGTSRQLQANRGKRPEAALSVGAVPAGRASGGLMRCAG